MSSNIHKHEDKNFKQTALVIGALLIYFAGSSTSYASIQPVNKFKEIKSISTRLNRLEINGSAKIKSSKKAPPNFTTVDARPSFDIPVTYNTKVKKWIKYFQGSGRRGLKIWLERSYKYFPSIKKTLARKGLPLDLSYIAMIESGFSARAVSSASAVGYWQFIKPTAKRYGLQVNWWLDERRDFRKSTLAAAQYLGDLYKMFNSWYLSAAAYNMGEQGLKRLISRYHTTNFWVLSKKKRFPAETREYIPKLIAAMLIAKSPKLYGFHNIKPHSPYSFEYFFAPGGTDLVNLARYMGVEYKKLTQLNPELIKGFIPKSIRSHKIRIPRGSTKLMSKYVRLQL